MDIIITNKKCKVLAPVGSKDVLKAAVFSGADYVYLSGKRFGARAYADNFDYEQLQDAIVFCHRYNVKVFVTVNTSVLEDEMESVIDYVYFLYSHGVDAVIIQDLGLASVISNIFPDLELHASTQMTIVDYSFVKWLSDNGFDNVNISREVPISRIKNIKSKLDEFNHDIQLEVFAHGALCYCYSGRCIMSSFLGGRSGNRGSCAQPCRMRYTLEDYYHGKISDDNYLLSTKDLCTYNNIREILDAGVDSVKIEGRMKSSDYVSITTYCYKQIIENPDDTSNYLLLNLAFNRGLTGGYILENDACDVVGRSQSGTKGYPIGRVTKYDYDTITFEFTNRKYPIKLVNGDGLRFEYKNDSLGMYVSKILKQSKRKITIANNKHFYLQEGTLVYISYSKYLHDTSKRIINSNNLHKITLDLNLSVTDERQLKVECSSDIFKEDVVFISDERFDKAQKRPLTTDTINKQLRKTGNTKYEIINISYDNFPNDLFMPISVINDIRRKLTEHLDIIIKKSQLPSKDKLEATKEKIERFKQDHYSKYDIINKDKKYNVYIYNLKQAKLIKDYSFIDEVYYDASFDYDNMNDYCHGIYDELEELSKILDGKKIIWILPDLLLDEDLPHIGEILVKLRFNNIDLQIQTDNIGVANNLDVTSYSNRLNIYNNYTIRKLEKIFKRQVISNEISLHDIKQLHNDNTELEYIIFGHTEDMITRDNFEDLKPSYENACYYLKDKRSHEYKIVQDANENTHIYDYRILNLTEWLEQLDKSSIDYYSIDLRHFNMTDTSRILEYFQDIIENNTIGKLELTDNNNFFEANIEKGLYYNKE